MARVAAPLPHLSHKERLILELLGGARERYGLELVDASRGALKRGTVYVTLGRMEDKGYVESWQATPPPGQAGMPRRLYRATAFGLKVLEAADVLKAALKLRPAHARS